MDFGQVEAFALVASHKSFSRAAEVLQVTQPSVTARIQSLERDLGEELFERAGRSVRLTDAGSAFLYYADRILRDAREGRAAVDEVSHTRLGSLKVGSAFTISIYILRTFFACSGKSFLALMCLCALATLSKSLRWCLTGMCRLALPEP